MNRNIALTKIINQKNYICYNKDIAAALGVVPALVFAELVNISDMFGCEEFYFEQTKLAKDTALSKDQIRGGIKVLSERQIITVSKKGIPCRNFYTIRLDNVLRLIEEEMEKSAGNAPAGNGEESNLEEENAAAESCADGETEQQKTALPAQNSRSEKNGHQEVEFSQTGGGKNQQPDVEISQTRCQETRQLEVKKSDIKRPKKSTSSCREFGPLLNKNQNKNQYEKTNSRTHSRASADACGLKISEPQKKYAEAVYEIWSGSGLPTKGGGLFGFESSEFRQALSMLCSQHLHSDKVLEACRNYASVISLKRQGETWWNAELFFDSFAKPEMIRRFLPGNFSISDYASGRDAGSVSFYAREHTNVRMDF